MAYTSNVYTPVLRPRMDASAAPGDTRGTAAPLSPDVLTYRYGSRVICVATGKDYEVTFLPSNPSPPLLIELE